MSTLHTFFNNTVDTSKKYKIETNLRDDYARTFSKNILKTSIFVLIISLFFGAFLLLGSKKFETAEIIKILITVGAVIIILAGITYKLRQIMLLQISKGITLQFSENKIKQHINLENVNGFTRFALIRNKARYNMLYNLEVDYKNILETIYNNSTGYKIKGRSASFLNSKQVILIPRQIENFKNFQQMITDNSKLFNLQTI